jgi:hypothetical protein
MLTVLTPMKKDIVKENDGGSSCQQLFVVELFSTWSSNDE